MKSCQCGKFEAGKNGTVSFMCDVKGANFGKEIRHTAAGCVPAIGPLPHNHTGRFSWASDALPGGHPAKND